MKKSFLLIFVILLASCRAPQSNFAPTIEFTKIPPQHVGGSDKTVEIEGRVTGAKPGQQIVLFAKSGQWWVQPFVSRPFTEIEADSHWRSTIHTGTEYAALLVEAGYRPPSKTDELPPIGNGVVAAASVKGAGELPVASKTVNFSGYEWFTREATVNRQGTRTVFDPANAWTDENGFLHLRISNRSGKWTSGKINLTRSLGYGTYIFTVRDISRLEPAGYLSLSTWDPLEAGQNHREMILEVSPPAQSSADTNLRYIIQPYYLAMNVAQFNVPTGTLTHLIRWEPGRAEFKTFRGSQTGSVEKPVAEHDFTLGIPTSEGEAVNIALYIGDYSEQSLKQETEVIIEKFEYLP